MDVVIADDAVLLREGLRHILERFGHRVVASVGDGDALLEAVAEHRPHVAVVDVRMPPSFRDEGLLAALRIRTRHPGIGVLVLSQYVERSYALELLESGAGKGVGYLLKNRVGEVEEFLDAVERVAGGGTVIDPEVVVRLLEDRRDRAALDRLTPRERQVLGLMAEGKSNGAIARKLMVTDAAVLKHVGNIFGKLLLEPTDEEHRRVMAVLHYLREEAS
ncbi:response regulator transcription factor [Microtetraspora fusca]|uniref:Response regulator n=1 Tax=Microtetraspora fusca TaxID=1997 RepID=A0ABW6V8Q5_MICFU|nr:response regulator transcription factor [Microtetraspora fusca]